MYSKHINSKDLILSLDIYKFTITITSLPYAPTWSFKWPLLMKMGFGPTTFLLGFGWGNQASPTLLFFGSKIPIYQLNFCINKFRVCGFNGWKYKFSMMLKQMRCDKEYKLLVLQKYEFVNFHSINWK